MRLLAPCGSYIESRSSSAFQGLFTEMLYGRTRRDLPFCHLLSCRYGNTSRPEVSNDQIGPGF